MLDLYVKMQVMLASLFDGVGQRLSSRRAAGFLEYALLALVAIIIFGFIAAQFIPAVENLFKSVVTKLNFRRN